eukprot:CAMPEP_0170781356 /NCGR_PEP_ID=MMETSP0733-20121128/14148_1 /TAXON_ID=186038 /ORGANISM="Fragilariopsis kerguelensis, Strain L26-C5" /LENGTH=97 /DNA_ID=CAMNT_0011125375 /DNA_START=805 /DNA_END=1099 /DNA_ORIENTATION=-
MAITPGRVVHIDEDVIVGVRHTWTASVFIHLTSPDGVDDHDNNHTIMQGMVSEERDQGVEYPAEARHGNCIDRTSSSSPGGWKGGVGQVVSKYGCSP